VDEGVLVEAARRQDFGTFSRTLRDHQYEQSGDDGKSLFAKKRERRTLRVFKSPEDGMFILNGRFDPEAGNRIEAALAAEERRLRKEENSDNLTAFEQRLADALESLVCADTSVRRPQGTTLVVTAQWDAANGKMADVRLPDGDLLPMGEALRLACDANILPCVFNTAGQELWVGRKHRSATEAQRAVLIARDKHCIGCGTSAVWCEAHHITEWFKGGPTDIDNLVLVCASCHHNIHDDGWSVCRRHDGTYELRPPPAPYAAFRSWRPKIRRPPQEVDQLPKMGISSKRPPDRQPMLSS